jgi:hypothetical protein
MTRVVRTSRPGRACGGGATSLVYEVTGVPVHSVLLMRTREEALRCPRGDIRLAFCRDCGFIGNLAFDPTVHAYSSRYEETQAFSDTFNAFHRRLAAALVERFDLHGKDLIEVGCGKGEFLALLCELGDNRGIGFDPSYVPERDPSGRRDGVRFVREFYTERHARLPCDFLCCKMTLEHIDDAARFVAMVRRAVPARDDVVVFFQVPEVRRVLREHAFWDVYYEHCSYFSRGSLVRLFRACGFEPLDVWTDYDDQYLMLAARPGASAGSALAGEDDVEALGREVERFRAGCEEAIEAWRRRLARMADDGRRTVVWGSGSKAVAFLTTLGASDAVRYTVDVNVHRQGTFLAGSGQEIVAPSFLEAYPPDSVIVVNPIYRREIAAELSRMNLAPEILPLARRPGAADDDRA